MKRADIVRGGLLPGALAGLVGGMVFGAAMTRLGLLPTIASLVRAESDWVEMIVHLIVAAIIGAGFGLLVWHQRCSAGETLFWGLAYGTLWWFLGPLTLLPLLLGDGPGLGRACSAGRIPRAAGPRAVRRQHRVGFCVLGTGASRQGSSNARRSGCADARRAGRLAGRVVVGQNAGSPRSVARALGHDERRVAHHRVAGDGADRTAGWPGLCRALSSPLRRRRRRADARHGVWFFLVGGTGLAWSLDAARKGFATLPGYLLFGAAVALAYQLLDTLDRVLFSDAPDRFDDEGVGTRSVRAAGRGALAGLVGGMLFTVVMVQIGFLPTVANLIGSASALTGFVVHLVIACLIGISYGLLFRRQSYDVGSALGWGVSYGFFWWILGPLTLMPSLLGATPEWTVEAAVAAFPSLVGHLAYGAGLALVYYWLEARYNPWWISHTQAEAARVARRKKQVLTSAPALWVLVVVIALTVPVLLGM